jgi:hypothetical protein
MKNLFLFVLALCAYPQLSLACVCISASKPKPPTASQIRKEMNRYFDLYAMVVRVRATEIVQKGDTPTFKFLVIESWKGNYETGDTIVAPSVELTSCHSTVREGDELLVGFNRVEEANIANSACPRSFPTERRKLEERYLRRLSRRHNEAQRS